MDIIHQSEVDKVHLLLYHQQMENAYPGSNILVVTLTNEESKRVEAQTDGETMKEAMEVLRNMFGHEIPDAIDILVPRWWNNRFQRGSYTNYPIYVNRQLLHNIKAPVERIFFTGEHTSEKFSGYVHGGLLSGIETSKALVEEMRKANDKKNEGQALLEEMRRANDRKNEGQQAFLIEPLLADAVSNLHKYEIPRQLFLHSTAMGLTDPIL